MVLVNFSPFNQRFIALPIKMRRLKGPSTFNPSISCPEFFLFSSSHEKRNSRSSFYCNDDFQQLFSFALICPFVKHTKCTIQ